MAVDVSHTPFLSRASTRIQDSKARIVLMDQRWEVTALWAQSWIRETGQNNMQNCTEPNVQEQRNARLQELKKSFRMLSLQVMSIRFVNGLILETSAVIYQ